MSFIKGLFKSRLFLIIVLVLVITAIPLTVFIAQQQQETRQRAAETDKPSSLRSFCINANCSQIRTYWNAPPVTVYYYFVRIFKEDGTKIDEKWTNSTTLKATFAVTPQEPYWFRVIAFQTPPTFNCDLANNGCPANDPTVLAWYNASVKSEENGPTTTARKPNDGELGMQNPTGLSTRCWGSTGTCSVIQLDWNSANSNIFSSKRFLIRTPGHPTSPLGINPWPTANSATTSVTPNTTYTGWTIQEYQGEPDMTDLEMFYGGIRSFQVGFGDISTVPPPIPAPTITQATCNYNNSTGAFDVTISWNPVLPGTGATYQATLNGQTQNFGDINTTWNTTLFSAGSYPFTVVAIDNIVSPPATGNLTCTAPPSATITPIPPTATPTPTPTRPPSFKQISATNTCSGSQPAVLLDIANNAYTGDLPVFVYRKTGGGSFTHIGEGSGTGPYTDAPVSLATTYEYYVSASSDQGPLDTNHVTITTPSTSTCGPAATATNTPPAATATNTPPTATLAPGQTAINIAFTARGVGTPGFTPASCLVANPPATCVDNKNPQVNKFNGLLLCLYPTGVSSTDDPTCARNGAIKLGPINPTFNAQNGLFSAQFIVPNSANSGIYDTLLKIPNYLRKRLSANQQITTEQSNTVPQVRIVAMDVNNDNKLDLLDYNILRECLNSTNLCTTFYKVASDFNADGAINTKDLTIFGTSFQNQVGD